MTCCLGELSSCTLMRAHHKCRGNVGSRHPTNGLLRFSVATPVIRPSVGDWVGTRRDIRGGRDGDDYPRPSA